MKEIIIQYGSALIAMLVGIAIFAAFSRISYRNGTGVAAALGDWIEGEHAQVLLKESVERAFDCYGKSRNLEISFIGDLPIVAGVKTELLRHFQAVGSNGTAVPIRVYAIKDAEGNCYPTQKQEGKEYLYLEQPGIYRIYLQAEDDQRRRLEAAISFPVQSR